MLPPFECVLVNSNDMLRCYIIGDVLIHFREHDIYENSNDDYNILLDYKFEPVAQIVIDINKKSSEVNNSAKCSNSACEVKVSLIQWL